MPRPHSTESFVAAVWARVVKTDGCWLYDGAANRQGRGQVYSPRAGSRSRTVQAPRFVWELTHGPIPPGLFVLHRCDVPACVRPSHLYLGDQHDNMRDMRARGRHAPPRSESHAKLVAGQVREIRRLAERGLPHGLIAARFGVSRPNVSMIAARRTWRDLD